MITSTTDTNANSSASSAQSKSARDDQSQVSAGFDALIDSTTPPQRPAQTAAPIAPEAPRRTEAPAKPVQARNDRRDDSQQIRPRDAKSTDKLADKSKTDRTDAVSDFGATKASKTKDDSKTDTVSNAVAPAMDGTPAADIVPTVDAATAATDATAIAPVAVAVAMPVTTPVPLPEIAPLAPENAGMTQAPLAIAAAAALKAQAAGAEVETPVAALPATDGSAEPDFAALIASAMPAPAKSTGKTEAAAQTEATATKAGTDAKVETQPTAAALPATGVKPDETTGGAKPAADAVTADAANAQPVHKPAHQESAAPAQAAPPEPDARLVASLPQPLPASGTIAAAQLTATVATGAPVPLKDLAVEIAVTAAAGNSRFNIRLDPAELGRIDVQMDVDKHGRVTSHLTVERPETLAMLRQDAPQLQRALEQAGLKTGDGGLQFSLRDDQSSKNQGNEQEAGRNSQRLVISEDETIPAVAASRGYGRMLGAASGVDISI